MLNLTKQVALYDEEVRISLHNFPPQAKVTLHGQVVQLHSKIAFASCGHYLSNKSGQIDLCTDASQGGTYSGKALNICYDMIDLCHTDIRHHTSIRYFKVRK